MLSGDEMLAVGNTLSGAPGETHSTEKYCAPAPQRGQTRNGIYDSTRFQEVDAMSATILENRAMDCALHARHQSMGSGGHRTPRARRRAVPIRGFGCSRGHRTPRTGLLGGRRGGHHAMRTRRSGLRMARTDIGAAIGGRSGLRLASDGRRGRWREERASIGSDGSMAAWESTAVVEA